MKFTLLIKMVSARKGREFMGWSTNFYPRNSLLTAVGLNRLHEIITDILTSTIGMNP